MIKDILKGLFLEDLPPAELALKYNITSEGLRDMLQNMEHMGYIKELCEERDSGTCQGTCACNAAKSCPKGIMYPSGKKYVLTEKGERMCCRD